MTKKNDSRPIEERDINSLIPYEKNAKIHTKEQVSRIATSIQKHGLINMPTVEPDGTIITGHGRVEALKSIGWEVVPVIVRYDLTKAEAAAARIADNKVAEGDVDTNLIQEELRWLETEDIGDLTDLGFDDRELAFLTEDIGELDIDLLDSDETISSHEADHESETQDEINKAEESTVPIAKTLGIKEVTVAQSRTLSRFIATICHDLDIEDPAEALSEFAAGVMAND